MRTVRSAADAGFFAIRLGLFRRKPNYNRGARAGNMPKTVLVTLTAPGWGGMGYRDENGQTHRH